MFSLWELAMSLNSLPPDVLKNKKFEKIEKVKLSKESEIFVSICYSGLLFISKNQVKSSSSIGIPLSFFF